MKRLAIGLLGLSILFCMDVIAAELPAKDADIIKAAGVSIHPDITFATGNQDVGYRFATSKSPEEIRKWYRDKLSEWSLYDQYGGWILYKGEKGLGLGDVMSKLQVMIQKNDKLPEWHSLDKNMTTEVVIMIPKGE
jgi:hypothetical protein